MIHPCDSLKSRSDSSSLNSLFPFKLCTFSCFYLFFHSSLVNSCFYATSSPLYCLSHTLFFKSYTLLPRLKVYSYTPRKSVFRLCNFYHLLTWKLLYWDQSVSAMQPFLEGCCQALFCLISASESVTVTAEKFTTRPKKLCFAFRGVTN